MFERRPMSELRHVVVVGGGFAGVGAAKALAKDARVRVTLVDQHNYHQFQPLLYQVATAQLAETDVAYPIRNIARRRPNFDVKLGTVATVDPVARSVTTAEGQTYAGDYLVIAAGSRPYFFHTSGADEHAFPLYAVDHAVRLRARILELFEEADRDPSLIDEGAVEFVVVGGGPTGVEISGALAEMIHGTLASEYRDVAVGRAQVHLVDHGNALLKMFSEKSGDYTAKVLQKDGVRLHLGTGVTEVGPGHVSLSDGTTIKTRCVIWGGGLQAAPLAANAGLPTSRGGRIDVEPDLTVAGFPGVYVAGDVANIPSPDGGTHPQLGSVAMQSGAWAGKNIIAEIDGAAPKSFHYLDKGSMAMIGRNAAIAEIPLGHHELHGAIAFAAWLGVHAALMSGFRNRIDAFVEWGWDYFGKSRGPQVLDRSDTARIDWGDDDDAAAAADGA
jgi:NADH:ubiquinone reductase (H+-translocating)